MKVNSHTLVFKDFDSDWYKKWAKELKQDKQHLDNHALHANKFWQNAVMVEALSERGVLKAGNKAVGFGVGQERLPALFAKLGVYVTATDQDFRTRKAGYWAKHELATSAQSLNKLGICEPKQFIDQVEYLPVDMTKVPKKLYGKYDFLWSNCALGHLGTMEACLKFIETSLNCLKPGGWAVHTTELNVLSNDDTVTTGDTVIFRLRDIYSLYKKLTKLGYDCQPVHFYLGRDEDDMRLAMRPQFGNDFAKIQVAGYLATQVILIIHKPIKKSGRFTKTLPLYREYRSGLAEIKNFQNLNPNIQQLIKSQKAKVTDIKLVPVKKNLTTKLSKTKSTDVWLDYKNSSDISLYGINYHLKGAKPVVLATDEPHDRRSLFAGQQWFGDNANRPAADLWVKNKAGHYELADHIEPKQDFAFKLTLNGNKLKAGKYEESFSIVQEQAGWVDGSQVKLTVNLV